MKAKVAGKNCQRSYDKRLIVYDKRKALKHFFHSAGVSLNNNNNFSVLYLAFAE